MENKYYNKVDALGEIRTKYCIRHARGVSAVRIGTHAECR